MFERIERSFQLMRETWRVLVSDPALMLFPVCSSIATLVVAATFLAPIVLVHAFADRAIQIGMSLLAYTASYTVIVFFNVGLVACARAQLKGEQMTFAEGLQAATDRLGVIVQWAFVAATVGVILRIVEGRSGNVVGRIVAGILGAAWTFATAMVVPVIAFEDVGPFDALKRSTQILRQTWGEALTAGTSLGIVHFLGILAIGGAAVAGMFLAPSLWAVYLALGVLAVILLFTATAAMTGIYEAALYTYAVEGHSPPALSEDLIAQAFGRAQ